MKKLLSLFLFLSLCFSNISKADYYVNGKIEGGHKSYMGFVLEIVSVDAVGQKGKLFNLATVYKKVSEYNEIKKRCWIRTELGLIGKALNLFNNEQFWERKKDGSYRELNLEYITFPCIKK